MKNIRWNLHLRSSPQTVFNFLTTKEGLEKFWAEKVEFNNDIIRFFFPNGEEYSGCIYRLEAPREFCLDYFSSDVLFTLQPAPTGGTVLNMVNSKVTEDDYTEVYAGWVSVLLNLKASADFGVDLRNHDIKRCWDQGYVEN